MCPTRPTSSDCVRLRRFSARREPEQRGAMETTASPGTQRDRQAGIHRLLAELPRCRSRAARRAGGLSLSRLRSFRPIEADLFYGRDLQIRDLRDLLGKHNIIVVLGGSGSGKSSLVRAGLVPKLNSTTPIPERVGAWYVVEFRPKLDPVSELFDAILAQLIMPILAVPQTGDDRWLAAGGARSIRSRNAAAASALQAGVRSRMRARCA